MRERSRVHARLILGLLFFAICLGLGYPGVSRYDPKEVEGLRDTRRYVEMLEGTAGWTTQQELRVLVPFLARPIYRAAVGRVGTWSPEFLALLIVNSAFVAWAAVLLAGIGERVTQSYVIGLTGSLLYLLSFNVANVQLAGLVDSVEAWSIIAMTWALVSKRWAIIPLIGIVGALGKETSIPLTFTFCAAWCLRLATTKSAPRALYLATVALLVLQVATITLVRAGLTGETLLPWEMVTATRRLQFGDALVGSVFNREMLYAFGWLLPLGLWRLRRLPVEWLIAAGASLLVALGIGVWIGVTGNVARPAFNAVGPMLSLSVAILLAEVARGPARQSS
ncbi:MAG TPA: hypothetical protein VES88_02495 [Gemmatimonadaceae bacterium]|nr:hypothetical protein [Gemmatimonadaceae bacterium]